MSLLSFNALTKLVEDGVILDVNPKQINSASIDLTLGAKIMVERNPQDPSDRSISLRERKPLLTEEITMGPEGYMLHPGQFILAQSEQMFYLPSDISGEYKLNSSMARIGLEHLNAGWCDAGWNGSVLTLELKNMTLYHSIIIRPGDGIGQIVFFEHEPVPADRSYAARGRYNGDTTVSGIKE